MKRILILSILVGVTVLAANTIEAQRSVRPSFATSVPVGATAKVSVGGQRSEGTVLRVSTDSMWLSNDGDRFSLSLGQLDSVWMLHRQTERGALIGGGLGAATLAGLATLMGFGLCETDNCGTEVAGFAFKAALAGGAGGALLGTALGSLVKGWRRVAP